MHHAPLQLVLSDFRWHAPCESDCRWHAPCTIAYTMHALCWLNFFFCLCRGRVSTFCLRSILHCGRLSRSNLSSWLCCASLAIESDPAADTFRVCGRGFRRCLQVHRVRGVISFPASRRSRSSGSCNPRPGATRRDGSQNTVASSS